MIKDFLEPYFDESELKRLNEILSKAKELKRTKGTTQEELDKVLFSLRYEILSLQTKAFSRYTKQNDDTAILKDCLDIIQAVEFNSADKLIAFCEGIQAAAPVDSYVRPEPWAMPGYDCDVIMAAGAFISGSSIELSADGPLRPPYAAYFQGGLTWDHARYGIMRSLQSLFDKGLVTI